MLTTALKSKSQALYHSQFLRQASALFFGKAGAQVLAFISYPILTRWYTPAQFGEFAFINSMLSILLMASCGSYDAALVITKHRFQARRVFQLAQSVLVIFTAVLCLVLLSPPVHNYLLGLGLASEFFWILPVLVISGGYWQIIQNWLIRFQKFNRLGVTILIQRIMIVAGSLLALALPWKINGLVTGMLMGSLVTFGIAFMYKRQSMNVTVRNLLEYAHSYRDFPYYSLPTVLLYIFSLHLPVLWLTFFSKTEEAGHYSLAFTMIYAPLTCLMFCFGDIFYQRFAQSSKADWAVMIKKYCTYYAVILLPLVIILILFGDTITVLLFGESWLEAGKIVQLLAPFILAEGILSIFMTALIVMRKQQIRMTLNILRVSLWMVALSVSLVVDDLFISYQLISIFSLFIMLIAGSFVNYFSRNGCVTRS